jgi:anti-anti-sigma factor
MSSIQWSSDGRALTVYLTEAVLDELLLRQIESELIRLLERIREPNVVLDFRSVKFLSSSALGMLIRLKKRCNDFKVALHLCNVNMEIERVFKITGLNKGLNILSGDPPD